MNADELILVSVDDHIVEPPDMFEGRRPAKYARPHAEVHPARRRQHGVALRAPGVHQRRAQRGRRTPAVGVRVGADVDRGDPPRVLRRRRPRQRHERRRRARVAELRVVPRLRRAGSSSAPRTASRRRRWSARTTTGTSTRGRVRTRAGSCPLALPMMWDAKRRPTRCDGWRRRAATRSRSAPTRTRWVSRACYSEHWDPLWQACVDEGVVVCTHIGSSGTEVVTSPDAPVESVYSLSPVNLIEAATDLVWSPMFRKFPELRVALSEGGIGWVPYFLERVDYIYDHTQHWSGMDLGGRFRPRCSTSTSWSASSTTRSASRAAAT